MSPVGMKRFACSAAAIELVGAAHVQLIVSTPFCVRALAVRRSDQVVLIIITLLFGAQQSVLGRDTLYLDTAKCKVLCLQSSAGYLKETNSG